jgi:hypothetical protein
MAVLVCLVLATPYATAAKPKSAGKKLQLVIIVSQHVPECEQLKQRLTGEQDLTRLVSQFHVTYLDVDNDPQRNMFVNQFGVKGLITPPVLGFAAPDGTPIKVAPGLPPGDALPKLLEEVLEKSGVRVDGRGEAPQQNVKQEQPAQGSGENNEASTKDARVAAVREARRLLREKKTAEAVALVAPFAKSPRPADALTAMIASLEKQGKSVVQSAREQIAQEGRLAVGVFALVKAKRLYGQLPAVQTEIDLTEKLAAKAPQGDALLKQAAAVDKARAMEEAGETAAAMEAYRQVASQYPDTQIAAMAAKRIEHLQRAEKK